MREQERQERENAYLEFVHDNGPEDSNESSVTFSDFFDDFASINEEANEHSSIEK